METRAWHLIGRHHDPPMPGEIFFSFLLLHLLSLCVFFRVLASVFFPQTHSGDTRTSTYTNAHLHICMCTYCHMVQVSSPALWKELKALSCGIC